MKKVFKLFLVLICAVVAFSFFNTSKSVAKVNTSIELSVEQKDFFVFVRVQEGERHYIYIYTDSGEYITKVEEL